VRSKRNRCFWLLSIKPGTDNNTFKEWANWNRQWENEAGTSPLSSQLLIYDESRTVATGKKNGSLLLKPFAAIKQQRFILL